MFWVARNRANPVKKRAPEFLKSWVLVRATHGCAGGEGEEAGAVVVGKFEDMVELCAAEEGGELQVVEPAELASLGRVGVCGGEDAVDLGAACEDAVTGFADENPYFGMGVFFFRGGDGGCEQQRVADVAELDEEDSHRGATDLFQSFLVGKTSKWGI